MWQPPSTQEIDPQSSPPGSQGWPLIAHAPWLPSQTSLGQSSSVSQVQKPETRFSPATQSRAVLIVPPVQHKPPTQVPPSAQCSSSVQSQKPSRCPLGTRQLASPPGCPPLHCDWP